MCTSEMHFYQVVEVRFAGTDPVWTGMHDWLATEPFAGARMTGRQAHGGILGTFATVLHLSRLAPIAPDHVIAAYEQTVPELLDYATQPSLEARLNEWRREGGERSAGDVMELLRDELALLPTCGPSEALPYR